ncbi:peptidoglycan bridge formation glycyltransferase FemA/FemB family protein [Candidatus Saccharibacteria bacterium]|nr:peptidoglycan bridge formation glycyltransferase FemA/FemB family protein [Candidatus Saccharibacteria bacterium]
MTFEEITEEEFRKYAKNSPYKSFMQTPEIAKHREENGWTVYYLAAKYNGEIKAASMLVAKPTFLGKSTFIAPGGPLLDLEDQALTDFFMKSLKRYVRSHNGYVLHISPYYELTERDRHGDEVPNGFNHQNALRNLRNLGFIELKNASQPKYMYALDLKGKTPEELMADFKSNTRGHIRKAEKMGVKVRELKREELGIFKDITEKTSHRRDFTDQPLKYYEDMYDLFVPRKEALFLVAETSVDSRASGARQREDERRSPVATGRPDAARELTEVLPLSAAMFMLYGDEVVYLFSGSDEKYMKDYNAQYELQWYMIKYAAEKKFKRYNFYGIHGLPDKNTKDGVYEFKKGFGGQVLEYIGTYELSIDHKFYQLKKFLKKLKKG